MFFPQAFYLLTFIIEIEVSTKIMRKSLSVELRQGKFVLNTNVLRRKKKSSNEGISKNSLNPNINLLRDAMKQWHVSMRISINFLFPCMITGLNSPRWLSNAILLKLLHHDLDKKLEKDWRIAFLYGFCPISPKILSLRKNSKTEHSF